MWVKEKLLVMSNFSFFPQCFQKACFPGASKGVTVWEWVNSLPNNKILDLFKFKAFFRQQNNCNFNTEILFRDGKKTFWEKEKMLVTSISPFPTLFSKGFFFRVV